mmetsp:Transcript_8140/g.14651  ORF Transcript_8140/g.14651 Transcript_8140/m.14651 type:complete len:226 (+) Transcript_8140:168-845(+)
MHVPAPCITSANGSQLRVGAGLLLLLLLPECLLVSELVRVDEHRAEYLDVAEHLGRDESLRGVGVVYDECMKGEHGEHEEGKDEEDLSRKARAFPSRQRRVLRLQPFLQHRQHLLPLPLVREDLQHRVRLWVRRQRLRQRERGLSVLVLDLLQAGAPVQQEGRHLHVSRLDRRVQRPHPGVPAVGVLAALQRGRYRVKVARLNRAHYVERRRLRHRVASKVSPQM